ncbi:hypothetical protein OPT61_g4711 [Boeremia exigua]|uniref:Uncharacterized protein n=1 Tax=Boeremia exigua TaxID=749465 RepID=A0ACC2ID53_9PLEO|nr:hypothetical protein OPT61_g4711 [Boeremia exigua]
MLARLVSRLRSPAKPVQQSPSPTAASGHTLESTSHPAQSSDLGAQNDRKCAEDDGPKGTISSASDTSSSGSELGKQGAIDIIDSIIKFHDSTHQFWWDRTGKQLAELLRCAGYNKSDQYSELLFFAIHIIPELGPAPHDKSGNIRWHSPHTPDGTPLDFSWEWGLEGTATIRVSFEPIGPLAGTDADPLNRYATHNWIKHLENQDLVVGLDLEWYHHFTYTLLPSKPIPPSELDSMKLAAGMNSETIPVSGSVVMRDIARDGPMVKFYVYPGLKARELGISKAEVVFRAIEALPAEQYESLNFKPLQEYLSRAASRWEMEIHLVSFDLISPQRSRIKIYTRAPNTSMEYLMDALTLGGCNNLSMYSKRVIQDVRDFWNIFVGDAPDVLPKDGVARGPGFYFTAQAGKIATPKLYISPGPFCKNDQDVLARLRRYFSTRHDAAKMLPQMDRYESALKANYGAEYLQKTSDINIYVSCALQKDQLRVVTYLCPQVLAREADAQVN